ncbi:hypothetical protein ACFQL3_05225 [Natronoarchaeum sp. GCM10025321]|uniref:hypothetical protein n=1 Tax=Natronoarchaeum sp. GCM10025321 TaxID=3252684 RepID=UPI003616E90D
MGGIEIVDGELVIDRPPNELDELAIAFTEILDDLNIEHVYVAGYLAILTGRSRSTEDIDVLLEPIDEAESERLAERLKREGMWGPAMPLDDLHMMLSDGDNIWVAPDEQVIPHIEAKFVDDEADRASLDQAITARVGDAELPVGPLELQIPYKLYLGTRTDIEDAAHLVALFEESLRTEELEKWVRKLAVEDDYDRLRSS